MDQKQDNMNSKGRMGWDASHILPCLPYLIINDVQGKDAKGVKSGLLPSPSILEVGTAGNLRGKKLKQASTYREGKKKKET